MLADTLFHVPRTSGLQLLQRRGERGARELTSWRLGLDAGGSERFVAAGEETVVVLQQGSGSFTVGGHEWPVSRRSVFDERATALYLPPDQVLSVRAATALEAVLISTPAAAGGEAALVRPEDVQPKARGRFTYAREVHDIFVSDTHARRLLVGETFNPAGNWSSFPPHKHDGRDGEAVLEEVYHYRIDPPQGFAHQMLYAGDGESVTHMVRDGDAVLLPYGYHPVSAPPGYRVYYLWALAGAERRMALYEDPAHSWIHDAPASSVSPGGGSSDPPPTR
jgi:5-deoxy-glucuronate isomerase